MIVCVDVVTKDHSERYTALVNDDPPIMSNRRRQNNGRKKNKRFDCIEDLSGNFNASPFEEEGQRKVPPQVRYITRLPPANRIIT